MNDDVVIACVNLVDRAGGAELEIGWDCPHAPTYDDDHNCGAVTWTAQAKWRGDRLITKPSKSPDEACRQLAARILDGGLCRCGRSSAVGRTATGICTWTLVGDRWEPGCDDKPISMKGINRGDVEALTNRAQRRAAKRNRRRK